MKRTVCSLLMGYGVLVAVLGLLTQQFAPDLPRSAILAGVAGGSLSALWGLLGQLGKPHRGWAIFTMAATGFVLLSQVVTPWLPSGEPKPSTHTLALLATVMLLAPLGTLMVVAHAGVPGSATGDGGSTARSVEGRPPAPKLHPKNLMPPAKTENVRHPAAKRLSLEWFEVVSFAVVIRRRGLCTENLRLLAGETSSRRLERAGWRNAR